MPDMDWPDAAELFAPFETTIHDWTSFQEHVNDLVGMHGGERFVWRGQSDAKWGLRSSLYRKLADQLLSTPTEDQVIAAEKKLLKLARIEWRLDGIPALQLFAQMQHVGVPTRLIDVTFNPLIAAWFAVARNDSTDDLPGRLLAFTQNNRPLQLHTGWNTNTPRWHRLGSDQERRTVNWGTGLGRKIWRPPALHGRIPAQNAAFIVDGLPIDALDVDGNLPTRRSRWLASELRWHASVPMRLARVEEDRLPRKAPVFTFLITPNAKREIRFQLEENFGYKFATVYADIEGLAEYVNSWPADALTGTYP
ncbi:FRG domain-containing protein [Microbacter sp. GSS18]|nr:FRG domain-containing protein [Microbacter sp. GSS18]